MPCAICHDLTRVEEPVERPLQHNIKRDLSWNVVLASANSCYICDIIVKGCRGCFQQHSIDESDILSWSLYFYYSGEATNVQDQWHNDKDIRFRLKGARDRFDVSMFGWDTTGLPLSPETDYEDIPHAWALIPGFRRTSPSTDSDEAFITAQRWINLCAAEGGHGFCDKHTEAELPKRIVHVGTDDSKIRLLQPSGSQTARYISLSHCWGLSQIITTTRNTLQGNLTGIPFDKLSKTFQDAIHVTRRLGIQYIWIDSLCIIQDDVHDWAIESAKMMDIYSNSYLTIAATHSANGNGGLFSPTPDFQVSGTTPDTNERYRLFFRENIDHHLEYIQDPGASTINTGGYPTIAHHPLLTRAWVYQERMLSTRVLHFGRYELFFECRSSAFCECDGIRHHGSSTCPVTLTKVSLSDALDSFFDDPEVEASLDWTIYAHYYIARMWWTLVSSYTALKLTKSSDRLPTMGGLAKLMGTRRENGGRYLAGLWEDTLNDDLMWFVHASSNGLRERPTPKMAPTWSWASVQTPVQYLDVIVELDIDDDDPVVDRLPFEHFAKVEQARVVPAGVDEFGEVGEGWIRVKGKVAMGVLEREERRDGKGGGRVEHYVVFPGGERFLMKADFLFDIPGDDQTLPGAEVYCVKMSYIELPITAHIFSLVLRSVSPQQAGGKVFVRIGCIDVLMMLDPPPKDPMMDSVYGDKDERVVVIV